MTNRRARAVAAAALLSGAVVAPVTAGAAPQWNRTMNCPAAESLVPGTTWHNHKLAPGVLLGEGTAKDSNGTVNMHVLLVDLAQRGVSVSPLVHSIAQRTRLTRLAAGRKHLVAATNTGYFDFNTGAPTDPLIAKGQGLVLSSRHEEVVGIGTNGRAQAGKVWLAAKIGVGGSTHKVAGVNEVRVPAGLSVFTPKWGSAAIGPLVRAKDRPVVGASLPATSGWVHTVPSTGALLVARGQSVAQWLQSRPSNGKLSLAGEVRSTTKAPFEQAFGVGTEVVRRAGVVRGGFSCDSSNTKQPARTEIGFANGGRELIIAAVADHPGTSMHGLDEDQMSKLMVQLGATKAFAFDGSGSTEMLARLRGSPTLSLRTYPADGAERPMPVGLGVSYNKPHRPKHKH